MWLGWGWYPCSRLLHGYHPNVKLGKEDIFKLTIGNDSLHQDSDDKGVRIINLATLENLVC